MQCREEEDQQIVRCQAERQEPDQLFRDPAAQLPLLLADMAAESFKLLPEAFDPGHPAARNVRSKLDLLRRRAEASGDQELNALSEELEARWTSLCAQAKA